MHASMKKMKFISAIIFSILMDQTSHAKIILNEEFNSISGWEQLLFPKIKKHTLYSIEKNGKESYLKTTTDGSASGIIYKHKFNIYDYPVIQWKWKITNTYAKGNGKLKSGEDYSIRIYIIFEYRPEDASSFDKIKYNAAKIIYGKYPPHSSVSYVWGNENDRDRVITSPYTDKAKMIVVQRGNSKAGTWVTEKANILNDYILAFGTNPPANASIAIMSDSDNTGESASAFVDYIQISSD